MSEPITTIGVFREATLTVYTDDCVIESEPVTVRPGQVAEPRVFMDSTTGRIGEVRVDVFDAHQ